MDFLLGSKVKMFQRSIRSVSRGPLGTARGICRFARTVALRVVGLLAFALVLTPATTGGVHGDVPEKVYVYSINHPKHGEIGTFSNTILDSGSQISVNNVIDVKVRVLLVVAHKELSENEEVWKDGRLVSFNGTTKENGKKTVVTGEAEGSKFVVEAPDGRKDAPANVFPNNPWTKNILNATVLLGTKTGELYWVKADPPQPQEVTLGDRTVQTQYYRVHGDATYELWFDERGIAVKFTETDDYGTISFYLTDETVKPASASAQPAKGSG